MEQNLLTTTVLASCYPGSKLFLSVILCIYTHLSLQTAQKLFVPHSEPAGIVFSQACTEWANFYSDVGAICEVLSSEAKLHLKTVVS